MRSSRQRGIRDMIPSSQCSWWPLMHPASITGGAHTWPLPPASAKLLVEARSCATHVAQAVVKDSIILDSISQHCFPQHAAHRYMMSTKSARLPTSSTMRCCLWPGSCRNASMLSTYTLRCM